MTKRQKELNKLIRFLCCHEGKKHSARRGDVAEIVASLSDKMWKEFQRKDPKTYCILVVNGMRRSKRRRK